MPVPVHARCVYVGLLSVLGVCFFNDTATTEIYTLSLHDALPILSAALFALVFYVNRGFFALIGRRNGPVHMLAGLLLHQLYYHYSVTCFVYCQIEKRIRRR